MTKNHRLELLETYLETVIGNLGHPVGCGVAPHPKMLKRMAEELLKIATVETV